MTEENSNFTLTPSLSSEDKRRLLAQRLEQKAAQTRRDLPPSTGQEALWFLHQRSADSAAYNTAFTVRIRSQVDVDALRRSLRQLMLRHEVLRTVFRMGDGDSAESSRLTQAVFGYREIFFEQLFAGEDEIERVQVERLYQRPFDLENGPLFRAHLLTLNQDDHVLLLCFHHIICDGWSMWVLVDELGKLLAAEQSGEKAGLPAAPKFEQFVTWQTDAIQQPELQAYWQKRLSGDLPVLNLPTDGIRQAAGSSAGASHFFRLDGVLLDPIKSQAQTLGVTPYMFFLATFYVLLQRYSGQTDIVVGSPTTGRSRPEFTSLVGYLANPIPLRADLSNNPLFADFLQQVRRTLLDGLAHQDYPLPLMVQNLPDVKRHAAMSPLFQVLFVYQKSQVAVNWDADGRAIWGGLHIEPFEMTQMEGQFDLHLEVTESSNGLEAIFKYNPDLWQSETIARMGIHWQTLLAGAADEPATPIGRLPLMSTAEKQQVLVDFNATNQSYGQDVCLHQLFEQQVKHTPERVALRFEGVGLTYAGLNGRANQLANRLRQLGVGPNVLVGIAAERSFEMVIGLLAILKAGGAYVPFDPSYPADRLAFMLADSAVSILLTQSHLVAHLPETMACIVCLNDEQNGEWPVENLEVDIDPDSLAYMIYTSGSTGRPKGALNRHSGIVNRLLWMQETYQLNETDKVLQKTPFSFDVSVWEFFWPLLSGATLVIARPDGHKDGRYLVEIIQTEAITTLHFVPSMLALFLQELDLANPSANLPVSQPAQKMNSLRRVICSGEALSYELQERFFERFSGGLSGCLSERPSAELHNLYGPTEAAIDVTYWHCVRGDLRRFVPIGRPVANTQIYIVDQFDQPVPVGVAGEILIGGVQVGQGYWQREPLTADRFVPLSTILTALCSDLSQVDRTGLVYRSGDLGRWLPDGSIGYLGRLDFQVKVRGFRIELEEIELALSVHPAVSRSVVIAKIDGTDSHLIAYIVADSGVAPTTDQLRLFLRQSLPDYMLPSYFVFLDTIPLSPNGKINRKMLPAPDTARPRLITGFMRPETAVEQQVAMIWCKVLAVDEVGVYDNFFDLGGHSLLLGQVRNQLQTIFQKSVSMVALFQYPTVQTLAQFLDELDSIVPAEPARLIQAEEKQQERADDRRSRMGHMRERRRRS